MKTDRLRYFAACNSEEGFHSFYRDVFTSDLSHIYIIKGGPGTGKSSLMRRVADRAEEKGYRVEEIYCSSDPASLDGVIACSHKESFAVLDGTAPHVTEMELPGVRDELLYIGDFWSSDRLRAEKEDILRLCLARADAYGRFYRYLRAAGQCERNMEAIAVKLLDRTRLSTAVARILSRYPAGSGFSERIMLISSIGMHGAYRFETFEENSDTVFLVTDCGGIAHCLYEEICRQARNRQMSVMISRDPLIPSHINAICLPDCRLSFVSAERVTERDEQIIRRISMKRYVDAAEYRTVRETLTVAQKSKDCLMAAALNTMRQICELHFSLESHYVAAMDFDALRTYTDGWLEKILP